MSYNSAIGRTDASSLIPEDVAAEILLNLPQMNPLMQLARKLPNMSRAQRRLPIMESFATAYFVTGDTGLKQTSNVAWENKYIDAEELAVIVPIPQSVLDDTDYDIWAQVRPEVERALSKAITAAVLYGTNIPASWTVNLGGAAGGLVGNAPATHKIVSTAYADMYEAILGEASDGTDGVFMLVEADGFPVTGSIAHLSMRGKLRNVRETEGGLIFKTNMQDPTRYELDGTPIYFPTDGSIVAASSLLISGDWNQLVYAMRQDITYTIAKEGVITDAGGNIIYNLFQQDMVALRAVMRLGFSLPNPPTRENETDATRYPFAILT